MILKEFVREYTSASVLNDVFSKLEQSEFTRALLRGVSGSSKSVILSALMQKRKGFLVVLGENNEEAGYLYNDLVQINGIDKVFFFPSSYKHSVKYGQFDPSMGILRTDVLNKVFSTSEKEKEFCIIVTYPESLLEKVSTKDNLSKNTLKLNVGEEVDMSFVIDVLLSYTFERVDYVYEPGQFAVRGGIIDVFSYANEYPYRINFERNRVESIRTFEIETQLSKQNVKCVVIIPNLNEEEKEGIPFLDYLPKNTIFAFNNYNECKQRIQQISREITNSCDTSTTENEENILRKIVSLNVLLEGLEAFSRIEFSFLPIIEGKKTEKKNTYNFDFNISAQPIFHKNFDLVSQTLVKYVSEGYTIYILSDSKKQLTRIETIFEDRGDRIPFIPISQVLHEGFIDNDLKICCFTDHQIFDRFHKYNLKSEKVKGGKLALTLKELKQFEIGDYIVHYDHGVGKYAGLVRIEVNGKIQEMVKLIYKNEDQIYVSLHSLHKLSKYRSKENVPPNMNKLGTGNWQRIKEHTKKKVKEIARDLILLYAKRFEEKGFAFSKDTPLQEELEASFVYEDTPDQLKTTADVKHDMESLRPMDRLICGDVGFGKTEIAIRAAFKAVTDGKQVAVLVPSTVLAFQHYKTFSERLKDFPCSVDYLSRARKSMDTKKILNGLPRGVPNIIVGTHRLASDDVKFKDLGLLIIDEEQKFGVRIKEKLRKLKTNVDTLTMTATPIPRTLQFSLMGSRDMSALQTPPPNRYPIQTELLTYNEEVLKEAINFELNRNGQVFVIENRISFIYDMENTIKKLVPDARTAVGHGQMDSEELEQIILDFSNQEFDVFIATTIVENGIDIPNANTILICNAQNFGLSELHQLRGRVGRGNKKAFCYLFAPPLVSLPNESKRRLQAIENFSDLGSGVHIAMQDLDIRGAGNLLGAEQSGFIADLGYDTYQKVLQEAVLELKNEEFSDLYKKIESENEIYTDKKSIEFINDCTLESDLELRFPPEYIPNDSERIGLYQELDNIETDEQLQFFKDRLLDRFGEIPEVSLELMETVRLRRLAKQLGFERLVLKSGKMTAFFVGNNNIAYYKSQIFGDILQYISRHSKSCNLSEKNGKRFLSISPILNISTGVKVLSDILQNV